MKNMGSLKGESFERIEGEKPIIEKGSNKNVLKKKLIEGIDIELLFPTQLKSYYASAEF